MLASVKRLFGMASTGFKLILAMLGLSGLAAVSLALNRRRGQTVLSRKDSSQSRLREEVKVEEFKAGHAKLAAVEHIVKAEAEEAKLPAIEVKLSAARARVAQLKKELGQ